MNYRITPMGGSNLQAVEKRAHLQRSQVRLWPAHQLAGVPARRSSRLHLLAN